MRRHPPETEPSGAEPSGLSQLSEEQIAQLVDGLNSLMEGDAAASMLVRCGPKAVPALKDFLLFGRPSSLPEPRRRAVKVLADLGQVDALITYLEHERQIDDPILRLSEEAVQSLAAELIARWPGDRTLNALTSLATRKRLIGICIAFGKLRRAETIPFLIRDLADGVCARPAEDALLRIGRVAVSHLCTAASSREWSGDTESPSSLQRRRFALRVLRAIGIQSEHWTILRFLSHDPDPEITTYSCLLGLTVAAEPERILLASMMLRTAGYVNWFVQSEIQQALSENFDSLEWVVRQYAAAGIEKAPHPAARLARAIVAAATRAKPGPQLEKRDLPSRLFGRFAARLRRGKEHG